MKIKIGELSQIEPSYNSFDDVVEDKSIKLAEVGRVQPSYDPSGFLVALFFFLLGIGYTELREYQKKKKEKELKLSNAVSFQKLVEYVEKEGPKKFHSSTGITLQEAEGKAIIEFAKKEKIIIELTSTKPEEKKLIKNLSEKYGEVITGF